VVTGTEFSWKLKGLVSYLECLFRISYGDRSSLLAYWGSNYILWCIYITKSVRGPK